MPAVHRQPAHRRPQPLRDLYTVGVEYSVSEMAFDCRDDAEDWIDRNQAGKRNLSPASFRIVSGRIYNRRKKSRGGTGANQHTQKGQVDTSAATAEEVASELGTSPRTIKHNGQRAALHDEMLDIGDEEAAEAVKTLPQADVSRLVKFADKDRQHEMEAKDRAEADLQRRLKAAAELKAAKAVHVSQNTGMPEWYTPSEIIDAARRLLALLCRSDITGIDLQEILAILLLCHQGIINRRLYFTGVFNEHARTLRRHRV